MTEKYDVLSLNQSFEAYFDRTAVSQITLTKPSILKRFETLNKGKPLNKQM